MARLPEIEDPTFGRFGKWNFDEENRQKLPKTHKPIEPFVFNNNVSELYSEIKKSDIKTIGTVNAEKFTWPINREQSIQLLHFFVTNCLQLF